MQASVHSVEHMRLSLKGPRCRIGVLFKFNFEVLRVATRARRLVMERDLTRKMRVKGEKPTVRFLGGGKTRATIRCRSAVTCYVCACVRACAVSVCLHRQRAAFCAVALFALMTTNLPGIRDDNIRALESRISPA